jgi:hypothetical protein
MKNILIGLDALYPHLILGQEMPPIAVHRLDQEMPPFPRRPRL